MKCNEAEKRILLRDSGELGAAGSNKLNVHLAGCDSCRMFEQTLAEAGQIIDFSEEPSIRSVQNVLRAARTNAPTRKQHHVFGWKPAVAMAASAVIALGLFLGSYDFNKVGLEFMVADTQMLNLEDQVVSIMYEGLSEDDLAFNFLMTYEGEIEG